MKPRPQNGTATDLAHIRADIERLAPWFHNLHLPTGIETAPDHQLGDFPSFKWRALAGHLPEELGGCRVLDIGCNAGFYSFALAERGASVLGIDTDPHYLRQAQWARRLLGAEKVRFQQASVYDIGALDEQFEIVIFMGVFYHLRYPLLALDLLATLRPKLLVFQSLTFGDESISPDLYEDCDFSTRHRLGEAGWPQMSFIPATFCKDPTNWWVPNHAAVEAMLGDVGFRTLTRPAHEIYICTYQGGAGSSADEVSSAISQLRRASRPEKEQTG